MGYYIRVLSTSADCIPLSVLQSTLEVDSLRATLVLDAGEPDDWTQLILSHDDDDGRQIASIVRDLVEEGSLGSAELADFADEIADSKPDSAVRWLLEYFPRVRCIYVFQLLSGTDYKNGWDILDVIENRIRSAAPSIGQADNEGFRNEDDYHILWQFSDSVEGDWPMGVLQEGRWGYFQMDLGNRKQREVFLRGQIPDDAKRL